MNFSDFNTLVATAFPFLVAGAGALYHVLCNRLPQSQHDMLDTLTQTVVHGIEQSANGDMSSAAKKAAAVAAVNQLAKAYGLTKYLNPTVVDMLIEAAVYEFNQGGVVAPAPTQVPVLTAPQSAL